MCIFLKSSDKIFIFGRICQNFGFKIKDPMTSMSDFYKKPKYFESKFSSIPDNILNLGPVCPDLDFRHKIMKYQCQIRIYHPQID